MTGLGAILRGLRQDIAKRARYMPGVVVEMIDDTHATVDIGKPVPAFVSPIFAPAVVVGSPVTVRIQDSSYTVTDAPQSPARLVTVAEMVALSEPLRPDWPPG